MKKKLLSLLSVMVVLTIAAVIIIKLTAQESDRKTSQKDDKINVITTFYPIYMIGLNLADQIENLEVTSLTELDTGCLHDYQLTTQDMKLIAAADIMVINGGGMESFLEDIIENYPKLIIIDASKDIPMLHNDSEGPVGDDEEHNEESEGADEKHSEESEGADEEHNEESEGADEKHTEEPEGADEEHDHEHHEHDHGEYNSHVWLNPILYTKQIENIRDGLISYINSNNSFTAQDSKELVQEIDDNADTYIQKVAALDSELEASIPILAQNSDQKIYDEQVVIFHESFAYLADRIGMKVAFTVPLDSDTALSAGEIAEIIDEVKLRNIKYLFTEEQYSDSIAKQIEAETNAKVYIIDSVVTGEGNLDSYLESMKKNMEILKEAMDYDR